MMQDLFVSENESCTSMTHFCSFYEDIDSIHRSFGILHLPVFLFPYCIVAMKQNHSYVWSIDWGKRAFNDNILIISCIKTNLYETRFIGGAWTSFYGCNTVLSFEEKAIPDPW
jgi:hypothetical protein